ncbi:MAG: GtrA family protein [Bacteroidetes bacterium]|nr:GtrA family protein [Bacteroidota bacterium]
MKKAIKQFSIFFIIGCSAVAIDFYIYNVILDLLCHGCADEITFNKIFLGFTSADIAKATGFMCGSFYTYYMNKRFTWKQRDRNNRRLARFFTLYAISFVVNILGNKFALQWSQILSFIKVKDIAFLFATGLSVSINFTGQKLWVFNSNVSILRKIKKSIF